MTTIEKKNTTIRRGGCDPSACLPTETPYLYEDNVFNFCDLNIAIVVTKFCATIDGTSVNDCTNFRHEKHNRTVVINSKIRPTPTEPGFSAAQTE
jgi:hypothetical protein